MEVVREEGNIIENVNYFLSSEKRSDRFPLLFDTQYIAKKNKEYRLLKKNPFLTELIEDAEHFYWMYIGKHEDISALVTCVLRIYLIMGFTFLDGYFFPRGHFDHLYEDLPKMRFLNICGVKIKNNSPKKYERKYLEELACYLHVYSLKKFSDLEPESFETTLIKD